uniref:Uncharacterized protein n=1 Tax=Arundo donax TaxID=35708 RepID=A0A0A8Z148_ARUDO
MGLLTNKSKPCASGPQQQHTWGTTVAPDKI